MLSALKRIFNDLFSLFFPKLCLGCEEALLLTKQCICYRCEIALPPTYFHLVNENPMDDRIATSPQLKKLFSLYYFESSGTIERMLYALKYQGNKTVGVFFGRKLAATIAANSMHFDGIVGVPLHLKKKRKRGYNQVDIIGETAAAVLAIPYYNSALTRTKNTPPLSKIKEERAVVLATAFAVKEVLSAGKHYLLLDDIFTTGATLNACAKVLLEEARISLSIATLAYRN